MLEKGDEPSLLTESLITHGIALYRLNQKDQAQAKFEQAIEVSERAGDVESAGLAAITLVEQLGQEISDDDLCLILERAREFLKDNPNPIPRDRLLECAFYGLSLIHAFHPDWTNYSLDEAVHRYEARQIRRALEDAGGVIAQAARLLGLTHQRLQYMLKNPHKDLRDVVAAMTTAAQHGTKSYDDTASGPVHMDEQIQTLRILHVEDDLTVAGLVQEIAQHEAWELAHRMEGSAALDELASDTHYDLLLVDHELPGISGIELIEQVRTMFHRRYMPIVMMSGTLDEAAALDAGADAFLRKPQGIGSLVETITRLVREREREQ